MKKKVDRTQTEFTFDAWKIVETDDGGMMYEDFLRLETIKNQNTMSSQMMTGYLCLSDIPKDKVSVSEKNGKKYLNVVLWINSEPDKFGNSAAIQIGLTKEERAAKVKPLYIGNLKINTPKGGDEGLPF